MNETVDQVRFLCNQMRDVLDRYGGGQVEVPEPVDRLETLLNALESFADRAWVEEMHVIWGEMEVPFAIGLDEGRALTTDERRSIDEAAEALRAMLVEY
jgi:hypothetical protein